MTPCPAQPGADPDARKTKASVNGGFCLMRSDPSYLDLARPQLPVAGGSSHRLGNLRNTLMAPRIANFRVFVTTGISSSRDKNTFPLPALNSWPASRPGGRQLRMSFSCNCRRCSYRKLRKCISKNCRCQAAAALASKYTGLRFAWYSGLDLMDPLAGSQPHRLDAGIAAPHLL